MLLFSHYHPVLPYSMIMLSVCATEGWPTHTELLSKMVNTSSFLQRMALCKGVWPLESWESGLAWYSSSRLARGAMLSLGQGASLTATAETLVSAWGGEGGGGVRGREGRGVSNDIIIPFPARPDKLYIIPK